MPSLAAGIDAIELYRVEKTLKRHPERFLSRVFTDLEIAYCHGRVRELAVRFAAKEAMMKALGTGVRGIAWKEIKLLGLGQPEVSMTHSDTMALAFVVATCETEIDLDDAKSALIERLVRRGWL